MVANLIAHPESYLQVQAGSAYEFEVVTLPLLAADDCQFGQCNSPASHPPVKKA